MTQSAEVFSPGDFIRDEIVERGWTQGDLASIMGRPLETVNRIISGKLAITPETARGLGAAFGTSAEVWLNLEAAYQLSRLQDKNDDVERRARLFSMAPIKAMTKRGWIEPSRSVDVMEQQIVAFFELSDIQEEPRIAVAARSKATHTEATTAQQAWFFRVRQIARTLKVGPYSKNRLSAGLDQLRSVAGHPMEARHVPRILAEAGVRFVVVEHLPKTKIDGAALWLGKNQPVVALSLRYDRIDWFWHTLIHELGHISHGDAFSLDVDMTSGTQQNRPSISDQERRADDFASNFLVPKDELEDFIIRVRPLYSKKKIVGFARRIGIHPGIIIGQLQYRGEIGYSHNRDMLVKVRNVVVPEALTDGWGNEVSV